MEQLYCGTMTIETAQIESCEEREWVSRCYEQHRSTPLSDERRRSLAKPLLSCETFDHFLAKKFVNLKRYGGEGAEAMRGFFKETFKMASDSGVTDVVIAMPHCGRLNLLTEMLGYPAETMFHKIQGKLEYPEGLPTTGNVLSHLGMFGYLRPSLPNLTTCMSAIYGQTLPLDTSYIMDAVGTSSNPIQFKVTLLGDFGVGRESLLERLVKGTFTADPGSGQNVEEWRRRDCVYYPITIDGKSLVLNIFWRKSNRFIGDEDEYMHIYYRDLNGAVIIYDMTELDSFHNVGEWIKDMHLTANADVKMILVGNKCDLKKSRAVETSRGKEFAAIHGISFIEASAKDDINVKQLFETLAREMLTAPIEPQEQNIALSTRNPPSRNGHKCFQ